MWFFKRPKRKFKVVIKCGGRHPYLRTNELDFFPGFKYEIAEVLASDYSDAHNKAINKIPKMKCWNWQAVCIMEEDFPPE